jgi:hypothetical protein
MISRQQQAEFRPVVARAWIRECRRTGRRVEDKIAQDSWYRGHLIEATRGRASSSKFLSGNDYEIVLKRFLLIADPERSMTVDGWSDRQNELFRTLSAKAWRRVCKTAAEDDFFAWIGSILTSGGVHAWTAPDRKTSYDRVMAALGILAQDGFWIARTAEGAERRMRFQIAAILRDLERITGDNLRWSYVRGIMRQANLPDDPDDCPAADLKKVLAILDSRRRALKNSQIVGKSVDPA